MRRIPLLFLILIQFCGISVAQESSMQFKAGDRFEYQIKWSLLKVGKAELSFDLAQIEDTGPEYLHATFEARTSGFADKISKVRDKIETWIDRDTGLPVLYKKQQREGKTERDIELHFDWETMQARSFRNGEELKPVTIVNDSYDPLSLLIAIANREFELNEPQFVATSDGKALVNIQVTRTRDKKLKTKAGRFKAQTLDVATKELQGVFEKSPDASIQIWLRQESPRIPIRLESEVIVGSFLGELVEMDLAPRKDESLLAPRTGASN